MTKIVLAIENGDYMATAVETVRRQFGPEGCSNSFYPTHQEIPVLPGSKPTYASSPCYPN